MNENERRYDNFVNLDSFELKDVNGNTLGIYLKKNDYNQCKVEFTLNNMPLQPANFTGRKSAQAYWEMIKANIKY